MILLPSGGKVKTTGMADMLVPHASDSRGNRDRVILLPWTFLANKESTFKTHFHVKFFLEHI